MKPEQKVSNRNGRFEERQQLLSFNKRTHFWAVVLYDLFSFSDAEDKLLKLSTISHSVILVVMT